MNSIHYGLILMMAWHLPGTAQQAETDDPLVGYPPLEQYREISERNLFDVSRRPIKNTPASTGAEASNASELTASWKLTGIVLDANKRQLAMFSEREGKRRLTLQPGDFLTDNWQLQQILPDAAILAHDGRTARMELREPRAPSKRQRTNTRDAAAEASQTADPVNNQIESEPGQADKEQ